MQGSCLCGDVGWQVTGDGELAHHCHCSMCRKVHGTAFATLAGFDPAGFRFLRGREGVRKFESSPGSFRSFCGRCGSAVPGEPADGRVFVSLGSLEGDAIDRPLAHIFVGSKAPWYDITDDLLRFEAFPPGFPEPTLPPRDVPRASPGCLGGSCLCGGVAFEVSGPIERFHHCHCSRCRRARAAAHASNLFVAGSSFRWTRGEDLVDQFKVPEAERFTQAFCRVCGSKLPRVNPQMGTVVVPAGSLDDEPSMRPQSHIFVGSKAPWYDLTDDLPRYEQYAT